MANLDYLAIDTRSATRWRRRMREPHTLRHPELVSGSISPRTLSPVKAWMLNQVQHDGDGLGAAGTMADVDDLAIDTRSATRWRRRMREPYALRHPELVSGSISPRTLPPVEAWMLNQVQHDGRVREGGRHTADVDNLAVDTRSATRRRWRMREPHARRHPELVSGSTVPRTLSPAGAWMQNQVQHDGRVLRGGQPHG